VTEQGSLKSLARIGGRFLAVGGLSTAIEIAIFNILVYLVNVETVPAKIVASLVALINAYIGSRLWTFRERRDDQRFAQLLRFLATNVACAVLGATIVGISSSVLEYRLGLGGPVWLNIANLFSIAIVIVVRFVLYHLWVFPERSTLGGDQLIITGPWYRRLRSVLGRVPVAAYAAGALLAAAFVLALWQSRFGGFVDEDDNILGGWLLLYRGELPYTGYFSHHMPLAYFVAAPIVAVTGTDLVMFRFVFAVLMFLWLLLIYRTMARSLGRVPGVVLVLAMTLFQTGVWAQMLVAETLIAYAVVHTIVLIGADLTISRRVPTLRDTAVVAVLGAIPVLASLSFAPLSLLTYAWFGVVYLRNMRASGVHEPQAILAKALQVVGWLLVPYGLFLSYLVVTLSLSRFVEQAYFFNTRYYSQFIGDVSTSILETLGGNLATFGRAFVSALAGGPSLSAALAMVLALSLVLAVLALVLLGQYLTSVFIVLFVIFSGIRSEAPIGIFVNPAGRFMIYAAVAIVLGSLVLGLALAAWRSRHSLSRRMVPVAAMVVAAALLSAPVAAGVRADYHFTQRERAGQSLTIKFNRGGAVAEAANAVLDSHDRYFVGPFDFYTQLYLDGQRSSIYGFFLPWHGACEECRAELDRDLKRDEPAVIIWEADFGLWGSSAAQYVPEVQRLLDAHYFRVQDPQLVDVYFRDERRARVLEALANAGFDATPLP
jgi:putative flippase GtrA